MANRNQDLLNSLGAFVATFTPAQKKAIDALVDFNMGSGGPSEEQKLKDLVITYQSALGLQISAGDSFTDRSPEESWQPCDWDTIHAFAMQKQLAYKAPADPIKIASAFFDRALTDNDVRILTGLSRQTPNPLNSIPAKGILVAFVKTAETGNLDALLWLEKEFPKLQPLMFERANELGHPYGAFREAVKRYRDPNYHDAKDRLSHVINHLLSDAACFEYVDAQDRRSCFSAPSSLFYEYPIRKYHEASPSDGYVGFVNDFVKNKIAELKKRLETSGTTLSDPEARLCVAMVRNLIRRSAPPINESTHLDDIRFLLSIPSVKSCADMDGAPKVSVRERYSEEKNEPNGLFRLAVATGQTDVIPILLNIPPVFSKVPADDPLIKAFIETKLAALKHGGASVDVQDPDEIALYFAILKNLIQRRDQTDCLDNMDYLLSIPAVHAFVCKPSGAKELFELAEAKGNQPAAMKLLTIPDVFLHAAAKSPESESVKEFVSQKLRSLHQQQEGTGEVFFANKRMRAQQVILSKPLIEDKDAPFYFSLTQNLIQRKVRGEQNLEGEIDFLLHIDSVRELAHRAVDTANQKKSPQFPGLQESLSTYYYDNDALDAAIKNIDDLRQISLPDHKEARAARDRLCDTLQEQLNSAKAGEKPEKIQTSFSRQIPTICTDLKTLQDKLPNKLRLHCWAIFRMVCAVIEASIKLDLSPLRKAMEASKIQTGSKLTFFSDPLKAQLLAEKTISDTKKATLTDGDSHSPELPSKN